MGHVEENFGAKPAESMQKGLGTHSINIIRVGYLFFFFNFFFFQAEDGIRDWSVTGVQTCALPIY